MADPPVNREILEGMGVEPYTWPQVRAELEARGLPTGPERDGQNGSKGDGENGSKAAVAPEALDRTMPGGTFALDVPDLADATLWGRDSQVLWVRGEPLLIVGPTGIGKTTLAWNLVLSLIGLRAPELLGLPVRPIEGRVLYIAADRPDQARRALRRMVTEEDRATLDERLSVWYGPLLFDVSRDSDQLAPFVKGRGAEVVFIDSLKDIATDLAKDEGGSRLNRAVQLVVASGIQLAGLHHHRKASGDNKRPNTLDDVYGSVWIVAGAGSVTCLWGKPGDTTIDFSQLKMPAEEVGPFTVTVDHASGIIGVADGTGPLSILRSSPKGLTADGLARALYSTDTPTKSQRERARRKLEALVAAGRAYRRDGSGRGAEHTPTTYFDLAEDGGDRLA